MQGLRNYQVFNFGGHCIFAAIAGGAAVFGAAIIISEYVEPALRMQYAFFTLLSLVLLYFITWKYGLEPIRIWFDEEKITFEYLARDLSQVKSTEAFYYKHIRAFSGWGDSFKLTFVNGGEVALYKHVLCSRKDDLSELTKDFTGVVDRYNAAHRKVLKSGEISEKRILDHNPENIRIILILVMTALTMALVYIGSTETFNSGYGKSYFFVLLVLLFSAAFFLRMFKKKKQ